MKNIVTNTIYDTLRSTALFLEGTDEGQVTQPINCYTGVNVSKTENEPIDQIQFFITAKRIQQWNIQNFGTTGNYIYFIGGLFEILNAQSIDESQQIILVNSQKEQKKKKLYLKLLKRFGINGKILTTKDLWSNELYWNILKDQIDNQTFTRGLLINDTLKFYNSKEQLFNTIKVKELPSELVNLPLEFIKKIGNWPAPLIYTPAEVSEGLILNIIEGVSLKIGQAQERVYDKYLRGKMSTIRLIQSVGLNSNRIKSIPVTPYIDKEKNKEEVRLYFSDSDELVKEKLKKLTVNSYVYSVDDNFGQTLNPIIEKLIYAYETAVCIGKSPKVFGQTMINGQEIVSYLLTNAVDPEILLKETENLILENIINI